MTLADFVNILHRSLPSSAVRILSLPVFLFSTLAVLASAPPTSPGPRHCFATVLAILHATAAQTTINNDPATLEVCIRASSALYLDVILSLPCRLCTRVHILSKMVLTLLHRMFVLAASLSGAVINSAFAFRFLSVWRSARWEHESEWEGIDTVWKVDPVKLIMGMLSVYFTIAAVLSYIGFFGIAKVRVPHLSPSSCPIELFFPIEKTIMGPIISRLYNS